MKIKAKKRKELGRKIIRGIDTIPGVIYGPNRKSQAISLKYKDVNKVFKDAGYSKLVDVEIEGEKKTSKALIREVQFDPITEDMVHISFYELDLKKTITAEVPVLTIGKSKAVEEKTGFLVIPFRTLEVRCLPENLPNTLEVDISALNEIGDSYSVLDLKLPEGVELTRDLSESATLAYIAPPQKEIIEEKEEEVEAEEGLEEGEEAELAEGEEGEEEEAEVAGEEKGEAKEGEKSKEE